MSVEDKVVARKILDELVENLHYMLISSEDGSGYPEDGTRMSLLADDIAMITAALEAWNEGDVFHKVKERKSLRFEPYPDESD